MHFEVTFRIGLYDIPQTARLIIQYTKSRFEIEQWPATYIVIIVCDTSITN